MGTGGGTCACALDAYVRGLSSNGTDVFVGTEGSNVDNIAQADHVAKWDGSAWSAMGSNTGGADGWFPAATNIHDLASVDSHVFATGTFQNANGDARADNIAGFDGTTWHPVGSSGAGDGPWAPARARPSRSSTGSRMRQGTSPAPAATPRRSPSPRSR